MKAVDLIKSFMQQAQWGQNADDGRPYSGHKWLTVKQVNFLWSLCRKEDPNGINYFENFTWNIDGYQVSLSKTAANGCRQIKFLNTESN